MALFPLLVVFFLAATARQKSPNIVFVLFDDLGWADASFNDSQFPTPNIDSLRDSGIELRRHYIHMVCSISRSQYLTGRYAMYQGIGRRHPFGRGQLGGIPISQPTIADYLHSAGYTTYAMGKWQVGSAYRGLLPSGKGFDHFFGFFDWANYDSFKRNGLYDFHEDGAPYTHVLNLHKDKDYMSRYHELNTMHLYRDKVVDYISNHDGTTPFYIYFAIQTVHPSLVSISSTKSECKDILHR